MPRHLKITCHRLNDTKIKSVQKKTLTIDENLRVKSKRVESQLRLFYFSLYFAKGMNPHIPVVCFIARCFWKYIVIGMFCLSIEKSAVKINFHFYSLSPYCPSPGCLKTRWTLLNNFVYVQDTMNDSVC